MRIHQLAKLNQVCHCVCPVMEPFRRNLYTRLIFRIHCKYKSKLALFFKKWVEDEKQIFHEWKSASLQCCFWAVSRGSQILISREAFLSSWKPSYVSNFHISQMRFNWFLQHAACGLNKGIGFWGYEISHWNSHCSWKFTILYSKLTHSSCQIHWIPLKILTSPVPKRECFKF